MKKILIVEDNAALQDIYLKAFTSPDISVEQAFTGQEAISLLQQSVPSLIILDVMLPGGMNGFDILEYIKKEEKLKNVPAFILTNLDSEVKAAKDIGAAEYFVKANTPITVLKEKVNSYLM